LSWCTFEIMAEKVLVLENYRQTLTIVRSLARSGFEIIIGENPANYTLDDMVAGSKYVSRIWKHPDFKNSEEFFQALLKFLDENQDISLIFPVGETCLKIFSRNADRLPKRCALVMPDPKTVQTCLNKNEVSALLKEAGVAVPESVAVSNINELFEKVGKIGYPCVIKPKTSESGIFGKKAIICESETELKETFNVWPPGCDVLLLQTKAVGYRRDCAMAFLKNSIIGPGLSNVSAKSSLVLSGPINPAFSGRATISAFFSAARESNS